MYPLAPSPEPLDFDLNVRQKGNNWLALHPNAASSKYPAYWNDVQSDVENAFDGRCAYLGHYIPSGHVDHFLDKKNHKTLTYEWSNYRWSESKVNIKKGNKTFLDPFTIQLGWIDINPATLKFFATSHLPPHLQNTAQETLEILNSDQFVRFRQRLLRSQLDTQGYPTNLAGLKEDFPLLANALARSLGLPIP